MCYHRKPQTEHKVCGLKVAVRKVCTELAVAHRVLSTTVQLLDFDGSQVLFADSEEFLQLYLQQQN